MSEADIKPYDGARYKNLQEVGYELKFLIGGKI